MFTIALMLIGSIVAASFARLSAYCFHRARLARNTYRSER